MYFYLVYLNKQITTTTAPTTIYFCVGGPDTHTIPKHKRPDNGIHLYVRHKWAPYARIEPATVTWYV